MKRWIALLPVLVLAACSSPVGPSDPEIPAIQVDSSQHSVKLQAMADAIKADPSNAQHYLDRAALLRSAAKWELAMEDLERALRLDTMNAEVMANQGLYEMDQAKFNESYKAYERCLTRSPEHVPCLLGQAEIELLLSKYSEAIALINKALRIDEYSTKGYWLKGIYHKETGDTTKARSSYATVIDLDPNYVDAYIQLGLLWADERPELSKGYYSSALAQDPNAKDALYNLGILTQKSANGEEAVLREAIEVYEQLIAVDPIDARPLYNLGYIQLEYFQHYDSAATYFSEAIARYPLYHQAYYNRGLASESMDQLQLAEADYRQALEIKPGYGPAALALGRVLGE